MVTGGDVVDSHDTTDLECIVDFSPVSEVFPMLPARVTING